MVSRNLPPSFFNANYHHMKGMYGGDLYADYPATTLHHLAAHGATPDPWQYAQVIILGLPGSMFRVIILGIPGSMLRVII